jgi:glycine hydroxymethyltransferase
MMTTDMGFRGCFVYNSRSFYTTSFTPTTSVRLMFDKDQTIASFDPEVWAAIQNEEQRQEQHIELIASENYTSPAVMAAQGTKLTNKYAEGYPHKRYYGGCEFVDQTEELAIERVKALFGAGYANVQPHSGSQANSAVYQALCLPGDTVLGMSLDAGGHLTHGAKPNFSGKIYNAVQYGLHPETGLVDYEQVEALAVEHQPKMIIAGFSAYSGVLEWARFREIADKVGAYLMVDMAHVAGLIAAGVYPNPTPFADVVTSTTHKTLRGPRGGIILTNSEELAKKINSAVFPGGQGGPLCHVIAAKAISFKEAMTDEFKTYQQQVVKNAKAMAATFMERGIKIVSKGTENHLMLVDLIGKEYTGKDADAALGQAFITVNKNAVPNDPRSPFITSGLRIGTPAITTRGFAEVESIDLANWICDVLDSLENGSSEQVIPAVKAKVLDVCGRFPVYG